MQTPKTVTRYIPAGMSLAPPEDLFGDLSVDPKSKKTKKYSNQNEELSGSSSEEYFTLNKRELTHKWINENAKFPVQIPEPDKTLNSTLETEISPPKTICKNKSIILEDVSFIPSGTFDIDVNNIELPTGITNNYGLPKTQADRGLSFKNKVIQKLKESKKRESSISSDSDINQQIKPKCDTSTNWWKNNIFFNPVNHETKFKKGLPLLKTGNMNKLEITHKLTNEIIIYGLFIPTPVSSLQDTFFDENVKKTLETMNFSIKTMHTYMWPAILRGLNVFMIGPPKTGKTLSYVPAITTFALDISQKYAEFSKYWGPLILIICKDSDKCKEIYCLFNNLIEDNSEAPRVEILTNMSLVDNCDILVAVLSDLEKCLKSEMITLKRICHLVLEEANVLLKNNSFMPDFLKSLNEMQTNRPHNRNIQVIVTSEKWTADLGTLMGKLYTTPFVCFQDFLQAALFSNIAFKKKKLSVAHKKFHLEDILNQKYTTNKSIVFCNEEEIAKISEYLEMRGIECISITDNLLECEIEENEHMWSSLTTGQFTVMLSTDEVFNKTRINTANWLIHYSAPFDSITFHQRFKSLGDNLTCPLSNEYDYNNISYFLIADDKKSDSDIFNDFFNELISAQIHYLEL